MLINFLVAAVLSATPLMFATLGELICEKAGNLNLGVEGMMWVGALSGFYAAITTHSVLLALLAAFVSSGLCAAFYAFLTVTIRANQTVAGLTLTAFGIGISMVLGHKMTGAMGGSPQLPASVAGALSPVSIGVFQVNPLTFLAIALCVAAAIFYYKTHAGLRVRSVGENPAAADAAGVRVSLVKYACIILGGGICGLGGAFMSMITANGSWQPSGIVNGFGWIAVALVIFVRWNPLLAILGAFVFGAFRSMTYYVPDSLISIPQAFYQMLPFVLTIVVLLITSVQKNGRSAQPAALGVNYFREER
ncbi:ABC transporter permease [Clostridia bacterium]|nr:ABC transporter permease [Clostridia bacterium]